MMLNTLSSSLKKLPMINNRWRRCIAYGTAEGTNFIQLPLHTGNHRWGQGVEQKITCASINALFKDMVKK